MRRALAITASALAVVLALVGVAGAWFLSPGRVDTVAPWTPDALLAPDAEAPLALGETDVLVFTVCTLRKDRIGTFGGPNPTTPFLDRLAERSVVFDNHFAQAPWTRPSMGALFTGRWPRALRLDSPGRGDKYDMKLQRSEVLLAEHLKAQGYATVGVVANPNLKKRFGFAQGFDHYDEPNRTYKRGASTPTSREVVDQVLDLVDQVGDDQPVYIRSVVLDTHHAAMFLHHHLWLMDGKRERVRHHDAALRRVDGQLARLLAELDRRRSRPLLLVFAVDHGEGLMLPREHGPEHGNHVYRSTVEVPWLIHHPALPPQRVGALSMNVDVVPTVLDLLGAPEPEAHGASHGDRIRGTAEAPVHDVVFSETFFRKNHKSTAWDGTHQLIRTYARAGVGGAFVDTLYAPEDWRGRTDLAGERPEAREALASALTAWERDQAIAADAAGPGETVEVDADTRGELEALGYVE